MGTKLRNVTLTLEESVARWARVEAARQDLSVSRFLANILIERMKENDEYEAALTLSSTGIYAGLNFGDFFS